MSSKNFFLKSMTGYGRGAAQNTLGIFEIELSGVNRRHLEVQINLPQSIAAFEGQLRREISKKVGRGQINMNLYWRPTERAVSLVPNIALALALKKAYLEMAAQLDLKEDLSLHHFLGQRDLFVSQDLLQDRDLVAHALDSALQEALNTFTHMRHQEGIWIAADLFERLQLLKAHMAKIGEKSELLPKLLADRLQKRVEGAFSWESVEDRDRFYKEVTLLVDRADISEEITRFMGHLKALEETILQPFEVGQTKGKKLDFLIQELFREINTIASKAQDFAISSGTIDVKYELEKMREQVQNIE